jgi:TetR/AcrR family transcriptional regulator
MPAMPVSTTSRRRPAAAPADRKQPGPASARRNQAAPAKRPGPAPAQPRPTGAADTRALIFAAAAEEFSSRGFDGASVDAIARDAHVNKAMLYYHFRNKLGLYREVVRDMLRAVGATVSEIAQGAATPPQKIEQFVQALAKHKDSRPWFPPLMLREMADGAPHLDAETLGLMRTVFLEFASILDAGAATGQFRRVHPVLAYISIMGPLMMNAVRERAAARPGRQELPMFAAVDRAQLLAHMQHTALRMLAPDGVAAKKDRSR